MPLNMSVSLIHCYLVIWRKYFFLVQPGCFFICFEFLWWAKCFFLECMLGRMAEGGQYEIWYMLQ